MGKKISLITIFDVANFGTYLQTLATAPSSKEFEINDLLRRDISLALKREEEKFLKTAKIYELDIRISFTDIAKICKRKYSYTSQQF